MTLPNLNDDPVAVLNQIVKAQSALMKQLAFLADGGDIDAIKAVTDVFKAPALAGDGVMFHGSSGILNDGTMERDVVNSVIQPFGLLGRIPFYATTSERTRYGILTGASEEEGQEEADYPCGPAPTGTYTACTFDATFGRLMRDSNTIDATEITARAHRNDTDLRLMGSFLGVMGDVDPANMSVDQILNMVFRSEMALIGRGFQTKLARWLYDGDPLNASAHDGYIPMKGLELQIATGLLDSSGNPCAALDSTVLDWDYTDITESPAGYQSFFEEFSALFHMLEMFVTGTGLSPATWEISVHPNLWRILAEYWAYASRQFGSQMPNLAGIDRVVIDGAQQQAYLDSLRRGLSLPINGRDYVVVPDVAIPELDNTDDPANIAAGQYASDVYVVPRFIQGTYPVLYGEYQDQKGISSELLSAIGGTEVIWTDDGKYVWTFDKAKTCVVMSGTLKPRVIARTPQLGAKVTNMLYTPTRVVRKPAEYA